MKVDDKANVRIHLDPLPGTGNMFSFAQLQLAHRAARGINAILKDIAQPDDQFDQAMELQEGQPVLLAPPADRIVIQTQPTQAEIATRNEAAEARRKYLRTFYEIAGRYPLSIEPVDPRKCILPSGFHVNARQTAANLNSFAERGKLETPLLSVREAAGSRVTSFVLFPENQVGERFVYSILTPEPNPNDSRSARILNMLGIDPHTKHSLLTIGSPKGALMNASTRTTVKEMLAEMERQGLPLDGPILSGEHALETTYIFFDDGNLGMAKVFTDLNHNDSLSPMSFLREEDDAVIRRVLNSFSIATMSIGQKHGPTPA